MGSVWLDGFTSVEGFVGGFQKETLFKELVNP